jgi:hypothetical protein
VCWLLGALPGGRARNTPRQCHQIPVLASFQAGIKYGCFAGEGAGDVDIYRIHEMMAARVTA